MVTGDEYFRVQKILWKRRRNHMPRRVLPDGVVDSLQTIRAGVQREDVIEASLLRGNDGSYKDVQAR